MLWFEDWNIGCKIFLEHKALMKLKYEGLRAIIKKIWHNSRLSVMKFDTMSTITME